MRVFHHNGEALSSSNHRIGDFFIGGYFVERIRLSITRFLVWLWRMLDGGTRK